MPGNYTMAFKKELDWKQSFHFTLFYLSIYFEQAPYTAYLQDYYALKKRKHCNFREQSRMEKI